MTAHPFAAALAGALLNPPPASRRTDPLEEAALAAEEARRRTIRPSGYRRYRMRSDVTHVLWDHEARLSTADALAEIALQLKWDRQGDITGEAAMAGIGAALAKSVLMGEPATDDGAAPLDKAYEVVNALGGTFDTRDDYERGFCAAIDAALAEIEKLGGRDPAARRRGR